jgi:hypothetical protein
MTYNLRHNSQTQSADPSTSTAVGQTAGASTVGALATGTHAAGAHTVSIHRSTFSAVDSHAALVYRGVSCLATPSSGYSLVLKCCSPCKKKLELKRTMSNVMPGREVLLSISL